MQFGRRCVVQHAQGKLRAEVSIAKLTFAEDNNVKETIESKITLGYEASLRTVLVRADPAKPGTILTDIAQMTRRHKMTIRILALLVGRCISTMLLRRPAMYIFSAVYDNEQKNITVAQEVPVELRLAIQIAQLTTRNWNDPFYGMLIAYYECPTGGTVMYSAVTEHVAERTFIPMHVQCLTMTVKLTLYVRHPGTLGCVSVI